MKMKAYSAPEGLIVRLDGEIDHHSAAEIRENLDNMIAETRPKSLVLELSDIDFMDSSGLGLVLGRYRRLQEIGGAYREDSGHGRCGQVDPHHPYL